jgi:hypothetical protein
MKGPRRSSPPPGAVICSPVCGTIHQPGNEVLDMVPSSRSVRRVLPIAAIAILAAAPVAADEGMWPFNDLPLAKLEEKHGFRPSKEWIGNLQRSAVRLSSGGSGSFVSADGLVLTNHHVGSDALAKLSTPQKNLLDTGFLARAEAEELRAPDLEVLTLVEIVDVTARVTGAVPPGVDPAAAGKARREMMATIEKESKDATGLQSEVVTLYQGGVFNLYRYKRYDDVRLVMAPETGIAFFGGDVDNFEYPRFNLDICIFRIYEGGKPAKIEHFLSLDPAGVKDGDLVFVAGHPGRTQRLITVDHLRFLRDTDYPRTLASLYRREIALQQFAIRDDEAARIARDDLFGIQNSRKARRGIFAGLLDLGSILDKARAEDVLRGKAAGDPKLGASQGDWARIAKSLEAYRGFYDEYQYLEGSRGFWSTLFGHARTLVRLAEESGKPNAERLPGFRESDRESLELNLYSSAPIYPDLEKVQLSDSLAAFASTFGGEHPLIQMALAGKAPAERAAELVDGTRLRDVAFRKELAGGGQKAIRESKDAMIVLARTFDPYARAVRKKYEDLVQGVHVQAYGNISKARFAISGTGVYPDATFTLRLACGVVKEYEDDGKRVSPFTTLGGTYDRAKQFPGKEEFRLPPSWIGAKERLDLSTQFNFVSTADIIGGNSGSPVVSRAGKQVGIIFDGNIQSLVLDIYYTEETARAVSVSSAAILEALRKVYGAGALADELAGK